MVLSPGFELIWKYTRFFLVMMKTLLLLRTRPCASGILAMTHIVSTIALSNASFG